MAEHLIIEKHNNFVASITMNRPESLNTFTTPMAGELVQALLDMDDDPEVRVVILTGEGDKAFCSGGDQNVKSFAGYVGKDGVPRLNVLDVQRQIRSLPKPVIAMVNGYAIGGGHVLHLICDLTIAAENARFGQTGPKVGSFDGGYGAGLLARMVGDKRAREIWYLCRQYTAQPAAASTARALTAYRSTPPSLPAPAPPRSGSSTTTTSAPTSTWSTPPAR